MLEVRRKFASDPALELSRKLGICGFVCDETRGPVAFQQRAALARIPALVRLIGNFERRVPPTQVLSSESDFFLAQRLPMRESGSRAIRRPLADDCLAAYERGPIQNGARRSDGSVDGVDVVAIDA